MNTELNTIDINAVAVRPQMAVGQAMGVQEIIAQVKLIQDVMKSVMTEGEHYGTIPGCGTKKTLLQPGAQKLTMTFRLAPEYVIQEVNLERGHKEYRIICTLKSIQSGSFVGQGVGCCSSMESKYRWRGGSRKCPECGKETIIKGKAEYGGGWLCFAKKGGCGHKWPDGAAGIEGQQEAKIENENPADTFNTVLKMAKKRAFVDATITATAASDIFTQDIGDAEEEPTTRDNATVPQSQSPKPDNRQASWHKQPAHSPENIQKSPLPKATSHPSEQPNRGGQTETSPDTHRSPSSSNQRQQVISSSPLLSQSESLPLSADSRSGSASSHVGENTTSSTSEHSDSIGERESQPYTQDSIALPQNRGIRAHAQAKPATSSELAARIEGMRKTLGDKVPWAESYLRIFTMDGSDANCSLMPNEGLESLNQRNVDWLALHWKDFVGRLDEYIAENCKPDDGESPDLKDHTPEPDSEVETPAAHETNPKIVGYLKVCNSKETKRNGKFRYGAGVASSLLGQGELQWFNHWSSTVAADLEKVKGRKIEIEYVTGDFGNELQSWKEVA